MAWKTSLVGKRLEEQREAQAGRACLARQELQFFRQKCPMLGQLVVRPLPLHRHAPSVGTEWTRRVLRTASTCRVDLRFGTGNESTENAQSRHLSTVLPIPSSKAESARR